MPLQSLLIVAERRRQLYSN